MVGSWLIWNGFHRVKKFGDASTVTVTSLPCSSIFTIVIVKARGLLTPKTFTIDDGTSRSKLGSVLSSKFNLLQLVSLSGLLLHYI